MMTSRSARLLTLLATVFLLAWSGAAAAQETGEPAPAGGDPFPIDDPPADPGGAQPPNDQDDSALGEGRQTSAPGQVDEGPPIPPDSADPAVGEGDTLSVPGWLVFIGFVLGVTLLALVALSLTGYLAWRSSGVR